MPTRRAFLMIGGAFAFGSVVGGACGYSLGAGKAGVAEAAGKAGDAEVAEEDKASGDARLDALRRLAVKAPIEQLVENWNEWFAYFDTEYQTDPVLWRGLDRLAEWSVHNPHLATYDLLTALVAGSAQDTRPSSRLAELAQEIRRLRSKKSR